MYVCMYSSSPHKAPIIRSLWLGLRLRSLGIAGGVNAPSGGRGQSHRGGHCFFERPPRKEKGAQSTSPKGPESAVTRRPNVGALRIAERCVGGWARGFAVGRGRVLMAVRFVFRLKWVRVLCRDAWSFASCGVEV